MKSTIKNLTKIIAIVLAVFLVVIGINVFPVTIAQADSTSLHKPMPSQEDVERYRLDQWEYNYFGGFTQEANFRSYDGSVIDENRIYPQGETTTYDYVMGQVNLLVGKITAPDYIGTFNVAFKRFTKISVDPVFLDTYYGFLGAYTLQECVQNGWLKENQFYFVYQFETILDLSSLLHDDFCHTDVDLTWDDLSITSRTKESFGGAIYENGYVYLRTLQDVEMGSAVNLFISFDTNTSVDHTEHAHEVSHVYNNIEWDEDSEEPSPGGGEEGGDGSGDDSGEITPDENPPEPFNSEWCELGYSVYANRVQASGITPCSYDYWKGRANIVIDTYARGYADYYGVDYGNYYNNVDGMPDGWALVALYQMYRAEYVGYNFQAVEGDRPYVKPFNGLSYEQWLTQFDCQEAYGLYVEYCEENELQAQTLDVWKENSKTTYNKLLVATGEAVTEEQTGTGTVNKPTDGDKGELGILIGKWSIDKLLDNVLSGKLLDGTFLEALFSGNVATGEPSDGGTDWGRILSLILFILIVIFIVWGVTKIYRFFKGKK